MQNNASDNGRLHYSFKGNLLSAETGADQLSYGSRFFLVQGCGHRSFNYSGAILNATVNDFRIHLQTLQAFFYERKLFILHIVIHHLHISRFQAARLLAAENRKASAGC